MGGLAAGDKAALRAALDHALRYRDAVGDTPIKPGRSAEACRDLLGVTLNDEGRDPAEVIDAMVSAIEPGLVGMTSPRFFGFVIGGSHPAGVAADLLVSSWGQNTPYASLTGGVAAAESVASDWILELLGLPADAGTGWVTGGTLANTVGIMAARGALLRRAGWDVEADGLFGAPEINVVIGAEAHSAPMAGLRYAGLGARRIHKVAVDDQGRMQTEDFARVLSGLSGPILVILQAGHINSGAFDPFVELIPLARAKGAWVHVDAAFGLWLRAVPELAPRLAGVEAADSWAVDLHKWLNAPYDSGMAIVRDRSAMVQAMTAPASYLPKPGALTDPVDTVMELSRRARGVASYAVLRTLGRDGLREIIAGHCRMAERVAAALAEIPGLTVMNRPSANQVTFRAGDGEAGDALTQKLLAMLQARGRVFPSHALWKGRQIIRISISGYSTRDTDIDILLAEIAQTWAEVQHGG